MSIQVWGRTMHTVQICPACNKPSVVIPTQQGSQLLCESCEGRKGEAVVRISPENYPTPLRSRAEAA